MQIGFIVTLVIAIFVSIFAIQNGTPVDVDLFLATYRMPLALLMMACLIIGAVMVLILGSSRQFKKRSESKEVKNKLKTFENDKIQADNSIKAMGTEIQTLKDNNAALIAKVTELEEKNKVKDDMVVQLTKEMDELKIETKISEGAGSNSYNEKSEA
ncbi:MAG: LapA family protein [Sedimentibacter sp.]|uniref:LapA family protein n=1 Tax=Sedimentibacter sp. TaxID=1960295 RepID=UPI00298211E6|nr:LapA family protein [Sedimentibacter sp.]MDW5299910.1 LapA family protein [Sedimentibacter sp.]